MISIRSLIAPVLLFASAAPPPALAGDVILRIDSTRAGKAIPRDFIGLSYETKTTIAGPDGEHYFDRRKPALVAMFRTLGVRSLRIGGNSVDSNDVPLPMLTDLDSVFDFARAARAKVIYSVRLQNGDPSRAAWYAKRIYARHRDVLDTFSVGNEPSYYKDYGIFTARWRPIVQAIRAAYPGARFSGPDENPKPELFRRMAKDFAWPSGPLVAINVHSYPGNCSYQNCRAERVGDLIPRDAADARAELLKGFAGSYEKIWQGLLASTAGTSLTYRLSETNSLWYGGLFGASDTHAAALWALDYMHWWAAHGAAGVNFHTGDIVGGGEKQIPCRYAAFLTEGAGYRAMPLAYGMKMFDLAGFGRTVPVEIEGNPTYLTAYATLLSSKRLSVTIINRSHGASALPAGVSLAFGQRVRGVRTISMTAPGGDVALKSGITIGGAGITTQGDWNGKWAQLRHSGGRVTVSVPAASASVVQLQLN